MTQHRRHNYTIPASIVAAGAAISLIVFAAGTSGIEEGRFGNNLSGAASSVRPVGDEDHVRGDPSAPVTIIEYSDFECPFCARLHPTAQRITEEYSGRVKWVYRHFPLSIHPSARGAALASECVADIAGNDAFWNFADALFDNQRSLGTDLYARLAQEAGASEEDFRSCYEAETFAGKVERDLENATASGGTGTPYTIVVAGNGDRFPFSGALPYDRVRRIIERALAAE